MLVHGASSIFDVDGFQFMRKYVEPDRVVIFWAGLLMLPASGLRFRVSSWICISQDQTPGSNDASVVESCYQIYVDTEDDPVFSSSDRSLTQQHVAEKFINNVRLTEQVVQSALIAEADREIPVIF